MEPYLLPVSLLVIPAPPYVLRRIQGLTNVLHICHTGSLYFSTCFAEHIPEDVDLVIIELGKPTRRSRCVCYVGLIQSLLFLVAINDVRYALRRVSQRSFGVDHSPVPGTLRRNSNTNSYFEPCLISPIDLRSSTSTYLPLSSTPSPKVVTK
jgi:hypothetical protein